MSNITPCLWFDGQAEEAVQFYTAIFPNSTIGEVARYGEAGHEIHGRKPGSVMTIAFELDGRPFTALNGGPMFKFNEAISLQIDCPTQEEVDYYWEKLSAGGDEKAQQCGWLKDKFDLWWQIIPTIVKELIQGSDRARADRAMAALLKMKKINIERLRQSSQGV